MFSDAKQHAIYAVANAPVRPFPYPHFVCDDVFPQVFYNEILAHLPGRESYASIVDTGRLVMDGLDVEGTAYKNRFTVTLTKEVVSKFAEKDRAFWRDMVRLLKGQDFMQMLLWKFEGYLKIRYPKGLDKVYFGSDIQLIRDFKGYSLGPHSDKPKKVAVILLYFPGSADDPNLGTSIYVPKKEGFTCNSGTHYDREDFHCIFTAPYVPNTAFGFFKTPNSFHGVERVARASVRRDLIQYSIMEM